MAQPDIENRVGLHIARLNALINMVGVVFLSDNADHFIDIEMRRDNRQYLEPMLYLADENSFGDQDIMAVVEISLQDLAQIHHSRHAAMVEHIHIE